MGLLEGKVAVVTGGGAGVGRGICRVFAREDASIVVDIDRPAAEACAVVKNSEQVRRVIAVVRQRYDQKILHAFPVSSMSRYVTGGAIFVGREL